MILLVTGGTGFIGKEVIDQIHQSVDKIYLLVRYQSIPRSKEYFKKYPNVTIIEGDITHEQIVTHLDDLKTIKEEVDSLLNIAGHYDIEMSELQSYKTNIIGVQNVVNFVQELSSLKIFHHISSYSASGPQIGCVDEETLGNAKDFGDFYARSKMQGELMIRKQDFKDVKVRIYRPGIVIGSTRNGKIEKIDGPYYLMKFMSQYNDILKSLSPLKFFPMPYNQKLILPLVPVDYIGLWFKDFILNPTAHNQRTYHLMNEKQIYFEDFVQWLLSQYKIDLKLLRLPKSKYYKHLLPFIGMPQELLQYMYSQASFSVSNKKEDYPDQKDYGLSDIKENLILGADQFFEDQT